ncbi:MAG: primosomal protein N' [Marmoricola sp.]
MSSTEPEQPALLPREAARAGARSAKGKPRSKQALRAAEVDPVAGVLVDLPLAHLDRPFDYLVPEKYADQAVPGARVKVGFAGQDVDGFVLERRAETGHPGRLQPLRRVVSPEPVLTAQVARLTAAVAARYAGTRSDVLRLAVPPRHAATEKRAVGAAATVTARHDAGVWSSYLEAPGWLASLASGSSPRRVWAAAPAEDWAGPLAEAVVAAAESDRGALVCVPDHRDLARLEAALTARVGREAIAALTAEAGPAARYAAFLDVLRGARRIVIGTRAAAFAPVPDLGLVAIWDDGDDLYDEPRAPYPHTREVLLTRAEQTGCAALLGAHARSVEAQYLLRTGWAEEISVPRAALRDRVRVSVTGDSDRDLERDPRARQVRLPAEVFTVLREALVRGPVLVQTPRAGYATRLSCDGCWTPAECTRCHGPLRVAAAGRDPECAWCGTEHPQWTCTGCGGTGLRAPVLGERRTAEELGRALPSTPVRTSSGGDVLTEVPAHPALVVATPGAEPVAAQGYAAVVVLDTWLMLARSDLRAEEEALRRWCNAAALVAPGGRVLLVGDSSRPVLQAMVRWDPAGFAEREIAERQSAHLPPASRAATVTGGPADVAAAEATLLLPASAEVLGPVAVATDRDEGEVRLVVRVPRARGADLSAALRDLQARRSARKLPHLRVEVDPAELG